MKGILIVPLDHSLMSFMAPWSDWMLQLRNSSVGLWTDTETQQEVNELFSGARAAAPTEGARDPLRNVTQVFPS